MEKHFKYESIASLVLIVTGIGAALVGIGIEKMYPDISGYWFLISGAILIIVGIALPFVLNATLSIWGIIKTKKILKTFTNKYLTNRNQHIIAQLSSEINENIRHLQVFWRDYQRAKTGSNRPGDFSEIARAELKRSEVLPVEFRLNLPNWYQVVAEQHSLFSLLSKKVATQVEQFHLNLNSITKIYDQIKDIVKEQYNTNQLLKLRTQWESLVSDVLERGNPLKVI